MITIACWKWTRIKTGHQLPSVVDYGANHVRVMESMLKRHVTVPYRFVCITDDPTDLECETIPLWETYEAGGCYHRLKAFSPDIQDLLGERFCWIDLDAVIVNNIDHILTVDADFAIHRYAYTNCSMQHYNGGLVVMSAGKRAKVWETFDPKESPLLMKNMNLKKKLIGSDQAWISHVLKHGERTFGPNDGVYEAKVIESKPLPGNACIVMFSGPRDPSTSELPWIKEHYR